MRRDLIRSHQNYRGFTLIELMIVITIIGLLAVIVFFNAPEFMARANDSRRKSDLSAYSIAFEHYYEDNHCYPDISTLTQCGSTQTKLAPYLPKILCDPSNGAPYQYETLGSPTCPSGYLIYTTLGDTTDKSIAAVGCSSGCGPSGSKIYNYGVASTNALVSAGGFTNGQNGGQSQSEITPNCYLVNGNQTCVCAYPSGCGTGCPGAKYRCGSTGTYCVFDPSCQ
jgi:prepilin-type N-terminal cleavage/methylation domain-containing protein